jgi:poly-gamma-glutamate synthesis protein (capsule biosynthesis protein)
MKKGLSTFFTVIFVIAVAAALVVIMQHISSEPLGQESAGTDSSSEYSDASQETSNPHNASEDTSSEDEPQDIVIDFLACPDNIIHPSVYADAIIRAAEKKGIDPVFYPLETADYDFYPIYKNVAPRIAQADLSYINVETLIGGNELGIKGYPNFNTPEALGDVLYDLEFDIFNVAHNHMLDSWDDRYLKHCYSFFTEKGGTVIGYYENEAAVEDIVIVEREGIRIAFLAYTSHTNGISLPSGSSTYIPYFNEALIEKQVSIAKQNADIILVSAHWGIDDTYNTTSHQRTYAQKFIDLGVDVVIGMGPHAIQPMDWFENEDGHRTLLVYSLGNFVSGSQDAFNMLGGMLSFDIIKEAESGKVYIDNALFTPVVTHYTKPGGGDISKDTGHRNYEIYYLEDYTDEIGADHGTHDWERTNKATLIGGKFSRENMINTVKKFIPEEFLPDWLRE